MAQTQRIPFAGMNFLYCLSFFLSFFCAISYSLPCSAVSDQYYPESETATDTLADNGNDFYCQPAEIDVRDNAVRAGLLCDLSADAVVWEKNKETAFPIASLTKMMVALIAMEDIFAGKVDIDTTVKVTPEAARMTGSKVYLRTGCCVSIEELLKAALISSGNDASYLLAQFLGGTESAFVARMNRRAEQLGMTHTFYSNSTGMPARRSFDDNRSSPSDLLILSKEMLKYDQLRDIAGMSNAVITQDQREIRLHNHNGLVAVYSEVDGFKTGFTQNAKYCLVATAKKNNRRLIAIVLGVPDINTRNYFVANTISRYYETLGMGGLERKNNIVVSTCIARTGFYKVKKGDTIYKIARKYGCSEKELKSWNHLKGDIIHPGQRLAIYGNHVEKSYAAAEKKATNGQSPRIIHFYTVRPGDTLWNISKKYDGISVKEIMRTNRIRRARDLKPGITLKIPADV